MITEERDRFRALHAGSRVSDAYLEHYYGVNMFDPLSHAAENSFTSYLAWSKTSPAGARQDRYVLEGFMARENVTTRKWMAASLGMKLASLDAIWEKLELIGMQKSRYEGGNEFVSQSFSEDLLRHLPRLSLLVFRDHNNFCERLHAELAQIMQIQIEPLFCETSSLMEEYPRSFAAYFDCLTLRPLSIKHSLWLDFRNKPISLPPDRCSKLYFAEHRDELTPVLVGVVEPWEMEKYERFLAMRDHA